MKSEKQIWQGFEYAKDIYGTLGIDPLQAMAKADAVQLSMQCWQGDDVIGFEGGDTLTGGIAVTGNYPGRARSVTELQQDIALAFSLIPGQRKLSMHANYAVKQGRQVDRDQYSIREFEPWVAFSREQQAPLDFNPTYFSHPMMDGDLSLSSPDEGKRRFWIEHGKRCREIGLAMAKAQGEPCLINYWMPDGMKDSTVNTQAFRARMTDALDQILADKAGMDLAPCALESKLFGVGVESFTVVSSEYSLAYALSRGILPCMDCGHYHPSEMVSAKITAAMAFYDSMMLHISRPVRWDSDHVVTLDDELQRIMDEIVWNGLEQRVHIGLDYFDASINRVAAWVIGMRNARKALLSAYLAPAEALRQAEAEGDYTRRLALLEERKTLPLGAVWDYYCLSRGIAADGAWLDVIKAYEASTLSQRG